MSRVRVTPKDARNPRQRRARLKRKLRNRLEPIVWPQGAVQDIEEEVSIVVREASWGHEVLAELEDRRADRA